MIFGDDLAKKRFFLLGRWLAEPSLNGRIMWADIKGKVNDVNLKNSCRGGGLGIRYTCRIRGQELLLFCDEEIGSAFKKRNFLANCNASLFGKNRNSANIAPAFE